MVSFYNFGFMIFDSSTSLTTSFGLMSFLNQISQIKYHKLFEVVKNSKPD